MMENKNIRRRESFPINVNYNLSLEEMIRAGRYNAINPNVTKINFSVQGKDRVERVLYLVQCDHDMDATEASQVLQNRGFEHAKIEEMLAFGAKYPKVQLKKRIVALGSVGYPGGFASVPLLGSAMGKDRFLGLNSYEGRWSTEWHFLAADKAIQK